MNQFLLRNRFSQFLNWRNWPNTRRDGGGSENEGIVRSFTENADWKVLRPRRKNISGCQFHRAGPAARGAINNRSIFPTLSEDGLPMAPTLCRVKDCMNFLGGGTMFGGRGMEMEASRFTQPFAQFCFACLIKEVNVISGSSTGDPKPRGRKRGPRRRPIRPRLRPRKRPLKRRRAPRSLRTNSPVCSGFTESPKRYGGPGLERERREIVQLHTA